MDTARCEDLFQLFRPVDDNEQTAALRAAAQHNEPPIASDIIVCDRDVLTEGVVVGKERCRFSESGFSSGQVKRNRHHVLAAKIVDFPTCAALSRPHTATLRDLPLTVQRGVLAHVDLRLA